MSSTTTTTTQKFETPFTTAVLDSDVAFWQSYIASRPTPTDDFFHFINAYHSSHGDPRTAVAHDVGTGPGNIATRLTPFFDHVIGSDVNDTALAAAPALIAPELLSRMTFVKSRAEDLASGVVPQEVGNGKTDLVVVSECMPLLDAPMALSTFHTLLQPGGTLAIYFYGRPIFADGANAALCDQIYDSVATRICTFNQPMKGTPGFPFHKRGAEAIVSEMDSIALPADDWESVERHKWNCDHPLLFNSVEGLDFEVEVLDRKTEGETEKRVLDRSYWADEWDVERVSAYLDSVYPKYREKAGEQRYAEVEKMLNELRTAMGGTRKVTFPVVLILATRK